MGKGAPFELLLRMECGCPLLSVLRLRMLRAQADAVRVQTGACGRPRRQTLGNGGSSSVSPSSVLQRRTSTDVIVLKCFGKKSHHDDGRKLQFSKGVREEGHRGSFRRLLL